MTASKDAIAPSAAPDWAILTWCDQHSIYIQLASPQGPVVLTYPRDTRGLALVLDLMKTRHKTEGSGRPFSGKGAAIPLRDPRFNHSQRDAVRDLLRRKGIIGGKP